MADNYLPRMRQRYDETIISDIGVLAHFSQQKAFQTQLLNINMGHWENLSWQLQAAVPMK